MPISHTGMDYHDYQILVVDEAAARESLVSALQVAGFQVTAVEDGASAQKMFENTAIDLVITNSKLPDIDIFALLNFVRKSKSGVPFIVTSQYATIDTAVDAMRRGATDFLSKPFHTESVIAKLQQHLKEKTKNKIRTIITGDPDTLELIEQAKKLACTNTSVVITGESGTGKELLANLIHQESKMAGMPFVAINCAALSESLLESELFGHEAGAFTGASQRKIGLFEAARNGTIFLDEITELPVKLQSKLLRVLQEGELRRVGGTKTIRAAPRVIAATNKNLRAEIAAGRFREDLYYRLAVFVLNLKPLRERSCDIPILVEHFLLELATKHGKAKPTIDDVVFRALQTYAFPGNIRELKNKLERAMLLSSSPQLTVDNLGVGPRASMMIELRSISAKAAENAERTQVLAALAKTAGNKRRAAELLKVSYKTLLNKAKRFGGG